MANKYLALMESVVDHCSAWIDPSGAFHPVRMYGHEDYARTVPVPETSIKSRQISGASRLEAAGWLHISMGDVRPVKHKPTQKQLDTLFDFACVAGKHKSGIAEHLEYCALTLIAQS